MGEFVRQKRLINVLIIAIYLYHKISHFKMPLGIKRSLDVESDIYYPTAVSF